VYKIGNGPVGTQYKQLIKISKEVIIIYS